MPGTMNPGLSPLRFPGSLATVVASGYYWPLPHGPYGPHGPIRHGIRRQPPGNLYDIGISYSRSSARSRHPAARCSRRSTALVQMMRVDTTVSAPVVLGEDTLFLIRVGVRGHPASLRAATVSRRIEEIAGDTGLGTDSIRAIDEDFSTSIVAGERLIMPVYDADGVIERSGRTALAGLTSERSAVRSSDTATSGARERSSGACCSPFWPRRCSRGSSSCFSAEAGGWSRNSGHASGASTLPDRRSSGRTG